jgi:hypothetical protein
MSRGERGGGLVSSALILLALLIAVQFYAEKENWSTSPLAYVTATITTIVTWGTDELNGVLE